MLIGHLNEKKVEEDGDFFKAKPLSMVKLIDKQLLAPFTVPKGTKYVVNQKHPKHSFMTVTGFVNTDGYLVGWGLSVDNKTGETTEGDWNGKAIIKAKGIGRNIFSNCKYAYQKDQNGNLDKGRVDYKDGTI